MEVHHHSHTARKRWTHYFWEFLMLFLAVFCGFLAEYQLEHKIEKERAEEYAQSLVTDLEKDQTAIENQIQFRERCYKSADTLMMMIKNGSFETNPDQAARNFLGIRRLNRLRPFKGTIDQLKASGSLRYFKNRQLTISIINYYNQLNEVDTRTQYIFDYLATNMTPFSITHFDARYNDTAYRRKMNIQPFRNLGKEEQIQLYNMSAALYGYNFELATKVFPSALKEAQHLISLIKEEYN